MAKTTDFDAIAASVPLNKTAGNVVARNGVHYEPEIKVQPEYVRSEIALPVAPAPQWNPGAMATYSEYVGKTFGRWRVIGLSMEQNPRKPARWVVRCGCGRYENRKAKALRSAALHDGCCIECEHLKRIKEQYRKKGGKPFSDFGVKE